MNLGPIFLEIRNRTDFESIIMDCEDQKKSCLLRIGHTHFSKLLFYFLFGHAATTVFVRMCNGQIVWLINSCLNLFFSKSKSCNVEKAIETRRPFNRYRAAKFRIIFAAYRVTLRHANLFYRYFFHTRENVIGCVMSFLIRWLSFWFVVYLMWSWHFTGTFHEYYELQCSYRVISSAGFENTYPMHSAIFENWVETGLNIW